MKRGLVLLFAILPVRGRDSGRQRSASALPMYASFAPDGHVSIFPRMQPHARHVGLNPSMWNASEGAAHSGVVGSLSQEHSTAFHLLRSVRENTSQAMVHEGEARQQESSSEMQRLSQSMSLAAQFISTGLAVLHDEVAQLEMMSSRPDTRLFRERPRRRVRKRKPQKHSGWLPESFPTTAVNVQSSALQKEDGCKHWIVPKAPDSDFRVQNVEDLGLPEYRVKILQKGGITKGVLSLGNYLIIGAVDYPDSLLLYAANVAAEILDPDGDGCPSDISGCFNGLDDKQGATHVLFGFCKKEQGDAFQDLYDDGPASDMQSWALFEDRPRDTTDDAVQAVLHAIVQEETYHSLTQGGYCRKYPKELGVTGWDSVLAKAVLEAEGCGGEEQWYTHPENDCSSVRFGTTVGKCEERADKNKMACARSWSTWWEGEQGCMEPDCDVVEFYHKVMYLHVGVEMCNRTSVGGPDQCLDVYDKMREAKVNSKASVDAALKKGANGRALLKIMKNPAYEQIQSLPTGVYQRSATACPQLVENFTCRTAAEEESGAHRFTASWVTCVLTAAVSIVMAEFGLGW